jgi:DNA-binding transcriptional ArsR family regulator
MVKEDLQQDVRELRKQIEALREALTQVTKPYAELAGYIDQLQNLTRGYFRLLDLYARYGSVSPDLVVPGLKDDISKHIVSVLVDRGDRNISQIAEAVKGKRGTASRRIVRERLEELEKQGVVVSSPGSRGRTFRASEDVVSKWSQMLGLPKYRDHPKKEQEGQGEDHV